MAVHCFFLVALAVGFVPASAELFPGFYDLTCPDALATIKRVVEEAVQKEARMGASLLRLHFHDCFVNGCDGSVLLDDTPTFAGEKTALPNLNSARGFDVIDKIKSEVDLVCGPGVVSCADILAVAARDSVVVLGGPSWCVHVGRRDSTKASKPKANDSIPSPVMNLSALVSNFKSHGLGLRDLVALSGAHTIGQARCTLFRSHIYNDTNIDPGFAASLRTLCPQASVVDNNPAPLDVMTPIGFDNNYFKNLVEMKGLLSTDQELFNGGPADELVKNYSENLDIFWLDFGVSMVKMGDISPLIGSNGEIRMNCRKVN